MKDYLLLVDENDNVVGKEEKKKCHNGKGLLHRAFLIVLFNKEGKILLTRRSPEKRLWANYWDGTVASHPREGENYTASAKRRVEEELGVKCKSIRYITKFYYHARDGKKGSEKEICAIITGVIDEQKLKINEKEISDMKFVSKGEILKEVKKNPKKYTPWFKIASKELILSNFS